MKARINRRDFLRLSAGMAVGAVAAACAPATPMVVEKEVIKEVPVEKPVIVEKEVPVEKEVVKEVPVEKVVKETVVVEKVVEVPKPAGKARVRFMTRASAQGGGLEAVQGVTDALLEEFVAQHPDIDLSIEPAPNQWVEKQLAAMLAGDAWDVFQAWASVWDPWVQRNLILDLQPLVDRDFTEEDLADFHSYQWPAMSSRGGVRVGMPKYVNMMTLAYNRDIFDEYGVDYPPSDGDWDYDDCEEIATALTKDRDSDGKIDLWGVVFPINWARLWPHSYNFGGRWVDKKFGKKCLISEPESLEGLQWQWRMMWERNVLAQPSQVENQMGLNSLANEMVAAAYGGTYPVGYTNIFGGAFRWDITHLPKGPAGRTEYGVSDGWCIWSGTPYPDASWELVKFLSGPVYQEKAVIGVEGLIPNRAGLIEPMMHIVRERRPVLEDVYLETIKEALEWGYLQDVPWFNNQVGFKELITPAMEKIYAVGDVDTSYLKEVCPKIEEIQ